MLHRLPRLRLGEGERLPQASSDVPERSLRQLEDADVSRLSGYLRQDIQWTLVVHERVLFRFLAGKLKLELAIALLPLTK